MGWAKSQALLVKEAWVAAGCRQLQPEGSVMTNSTVLAVPSRRCCGVPMVMFALVGPCLLWPCLRRLLA